MEMILRWMPVKADRGLPGDLVAAFRSSGWIPIGQVPRIFRPLVLPPMPAATAGPRGAAARCSALVAGGAAIGRGHSLCGTSIAASIPCPCRWPRITPTPSISILRQLCNTGRTNIPSRAVGKSRKNT